MIVLLLLLFVSIARASGPIYDTQFDYLRLIQQWGPAVCRVETCMPHVPLRGVRRFTLHGLWPQRNFDDGPKNCNPDYGFEPKELSPALLGDMNRYWPSFKIEGKSFFWIREWVRHGSCSNLDKLTFFQLTINIYRMHNISDILVGAGVTFGSKATPMTIFNVIKRATSFKPTLKCRRTPGGTRLLVEVGLCLDRAGAAFQDCSYPHYDGCGNAYGDSIGFAALWP